MRKSLIDIVVVEELAVTRGAKTTRVLAHFECCSCLAALRHGIPVITVRAGEARNMILGCPVNISKEDAHKLVKMQFPDLELPATNRGGPDVADAYVLTQAGPLSL